MLSMLFALAWGGGLAAADTILTLPAAVARAEAAHPSLRAARHAVAAAEASVHAAGALRDPVWTMTREQTAADVWQVTAQIDQAVELFGTRGAREAAAQARLRVARAELEALERRMTAEVTTAYAAARSADRLVALADTALLHLSRGLRILERRQEAGDASGYEVRRLRLEVTRAEGTAAESRARRDAATAALTALVGLPPDVRPTLTDDLRAAPLPTVDQSLADLVSRHDSASVVAAVEAEAAEAEARLARRNRIPVPSIGIGFKEERAGTADRLTGYIAQVSLPLPVWGGRGAVARAEEAVAARGTARIEDAIRAGWRDALAMLADATAMTSRLAGLSAWVRDDGVSARTAADAAFAEGEMSLLAWLDAQAAFFDAAREEAMLQAGLIARAAALARVSGLPLVTR